MATRKLLRETSGRIDGDAVACLVGGGLLLASAALNAYVYFSGYRAVPTVGGQILAESASALAAGIGLLVLFCARGTAARRAFRSFSVQQVAGALGAMVALATVCAYAAALDLGTFGYKAVPSIAGVASAGVELVAFALLGRLACSGVRPGIPAAPTRAVLGSAALGLLVVAAVAAPAPVAASPRPKQSQVVVLTSAATPAHALARFSLHDGPVVAVGKRVVEARPPAHRARPATPAKRTAKSSHASAHRRSAGSR